MIEEQTISFTVKDHPLVKAADRGLREARQNIADAQALARQEDERAHGLREQAARAEVQADLGGGTRAQVQAILKEIESAKMRAHAAREEMLRRQEVVAVMEERLGAAEEAAAEEIQQAYHEQVHLMLPRFADALREASAVQSVLQNLYDSAMGSNQVQAQRRRKGVIRTISIPTIRELRPETMTYQNADRVLREMGYV